MSKPTKRWETPTPLDAATRAELADFPPIVAQLLHNRGHHTRAAAQAYLAGELTQSDDPFQLTGLEATVDRLRHALAVGEPIVIYGDYDTDGVTATALLVQTLTALGGQVRPYIPHREDEGYGLNHEALKALKAEGARLVVTVDCGIRSVAEADTARAIGLDLIITDHHAPGDELPPAVAVVNQKQPGDAYPDKDLCGAGIAFKLAQGLLRGQPNPPLTASEVLDLVALGTVSDLVPLRGENRRLVRQGLRVINRPKRIGLRALIEAARLKPGVIDAGNIGFAMGPRLNAAGRLDSALAAYELLTTTDPGRALELAQLLEAQNRDRQALTRETQVRARELALAGEGQRFLLFAADPEFRHGVVGLAAARLTDEYHRPAVVARTEADFTRGSARSIPDFDITAAFDECRALLTKHGGHKAAAGFTAPTANLPALAAQLEAIAERELAGKELRPVLKVDAEVALNAVTFDLAKTLRQFEPCGYGNPAPVLASRGVRVVSSRFVGAEAQHLKLNLSDGWGSVEAIAFNQGDLRGRVPAMVDLAYVVEINEWNGEQRLQLNVRDLRPAGAE